MAQQQPDQRKTLLQLLLIWSVVWILLLLVFQRFNPPRSTGPDPAAQDAKTVLAKVEQLRKEASQLQQAGKSQDRDKKLQEAISLCQEVVNRSKGTEDAARALVVEAEIYGYDRKDPKQAYYTLRQLERYYANTQVFKEEGKARLQEFGTLVDQANRQFLSYQIIDGIVRFFGRTGWSYVAALFVIALLVRLVQIPFTNKQFQNMRKMMQIAPLVKELQEKYKGEELARKQMELWKKYHVNPFSGCLYMLIPFPFLIWVYNMILLYQVPFQEGHFLWINPTFGQRYPGWVASHLGQFDVILLAIYAVSMYITSRVSITDPSQAQQQKMMSILMTVMLVFFSWQAGWSAAFILYWLLTNVFYTIHYQIAMHRPMESLVVQQPKPTGNGLNPVVGGGKDGPKPPFQRRKGKRTRRAR